jgi:hexosaminidase
MRNKTQQGLTRSTGYAAICGLALASLGFTAGHRPLLPRPQQVQYGAGQLLLKGLSIRLPGDAGAEDWFAGNQLSSCLSTDAASHIPVIQSPVAGAVLQLERTGPVDPLPKPGETPGPKSVEAYSIEITPSGGRLRARSSRGEFYGVQTLCQMVEGRQHDATLPAVTVRDWPSLAYRGVLVDMSEGPLPTAEEVKRQIDFLARWKVNQYYFYNEDNVGLKGYSLINPGARFTEHQIRNIVSYARERHIDLIPTLELYGHQHDLFRIEKYSELSDFPNGGEFNPRNPKVMNLLKNWAAQYSRLFPSPFVHIGFDETWQIQEAAKRDETTPVALFISQLNSVSQLFERHGKHVLAWGDIMVKFPGIIPELSPGLIAVAWWYDPYPDPTYLRWLEPLVQYHVSHMIATGVNSWSEVVPDFKLTFDNIDTFMAAGRKSGALGLINTLWPDDRQLLMRMSWPGLAYGAAAGWQTAPVNRRSFFSDYAALMYTDSADVATALHNVAQAETDLQKVLGQDTMVRLWGNPFSSATLKKCAQYRHDLQEARLLAEDAQAHLHHALAANHDPLTLSSLSFGAHLLDYAGMKYLYALQISEAWQALGNHPTPEHLGNDFIATLQDRLYDLMDMITGLKPIYQRQWLAEYRPYRLDTALEWWDAEARYWHHIEVRFEAFTTNYHGGQQLPALSSLTQ